MHKKFGLGCLACCLGGIGVVLHAATLIDWLAALVSICGLIFFLYRMVQRSQWQRRGVSDWRGMTGGRLSYWAAGFPLLLAVCLLSGQFSAMHVLTTRNMAAQTLLLATSGSGVLLVQGDVSGTLEKVGNHLQGVFQIVSLYTAQGEQALSVRPAVWLSMALPRQTVHATGTSQVVMRAYAKISDVTPGRFLSVYVHVHKVKPGPFAVVLLRRDITLEASASIYGVTVLPDQADSFDIWAAYGSVLGWLRGRVQAGTGSFASAWLMAVALGDRSGLNRQFVQTLANIGVVHALIASGATINMTVLPLMRRLAQRPFARPRSWYPLALILLSGLLFLTGFALPALRAALVYGYRISAKACGRPTDAFTASALAAALLTLWQPDVWWDPGVLLSFLAAFMLSRLSKQLGVLLPAKWPPWLRSALARAGAAELGVTPLIAVLFQQFSLVSWLINLLLYPLLEAAIPFCFAVVLLCAVSPLCLQLVQPLMASGAGELDQFVNALKRMPLVLHLRPLSYEEVIGYYIALWLLLVFVNRYATRTRRRYL